MNELSGTAPAPAPHALYRFFDGEGDLLYVGMTLDPGARWDAHSREKVWWHEVASITLEQFPDRASVVDAETVAIFDEVPRYNRLRPIPAGRLSLLRRDREPAPMVVVNFRVPADVKARAASRAEREGFSLSDVLRQFLITWADREGPPA